MPTDLQSQQTWPNNYNMQSTDPENSHGFWIEQIGNHSLAEFDCSPRSAEASLTGWVHSGISQFYNFVNNVLGYPWVDANGALHRKLPMQHPRHGGLYASRVTNARGVKYTGKEEGVVTYLQEQQGLKDIAKYKRTLVTIDFTTPRYTILADDKVAAEYERFVEYDAKPQIDVLTIPTPGGFFFVEGTSGNPNGKSFPNELNYFEAKTSFSLRWRQVPENFILDTDSYEFGYPTKINAAAGRVNSKEFSGYPAGTLLLLEPEIERYVSGTLKRLDGKPCVLCDVVLPLLHFDPPLGGGLGVHGHNCKPWWWDGTDVKYYLVNSKADNSGARIYGSYDFADLFTHWSL